MKKLTIFTPTYNRAYILENLYSSLCRQSCKNFEWLIVDDGSKDGTEALVKSWQMEKKISVRYIYQENGGKMRAHNKGVKHANAQLFVCVDSDDYLADDGVEQILSCWERSDPKPQIAGIVAYRGKSADKVLETEFPDTRNSTLNDLYKKGFRGDTTLVYRTEVLRSFLFPEIEGEKFISEAYVYAQIDRCFELIVLPRIIIICTYLADGYTRNLLKVRKENPKGFALYNNQKACYADSYKEKCLHTINYVSDALTGGNTHIIRDASCRTLAFWMYPLGFLVYWKRKHGKK